MRKYQQINVYIYQCVLQVLSADFLQNDLKKNIYFRNTIRASNGLDPFQERHSVCVGSNLGQNCLQRLSADNKKLQLARKWLTLYSTQAPLDAFEM